MSRKNKTTEKTVNEKNDANEELEENDSDEERDEEISELEEDVDDSNLNLQDLEFHQFMQLSREPQSGSPALERIADSVPRPIFVGGIPRETDGFSEGNSRDESGYVPGAAGNPETKYFSEPREDSMPEHIDFTTRGRSGRTNEFREEINQERFFRQPEVRIESRSQEKFEKVEKYRPKLERI